MSNFETYVQNFKFKQERFLDGCDAVEEMGLWDKDSYGEMDVFYTNDLISVILRLIAVDGKITQKEVKYLNETFDFSYTLGELTEVYDACKENLGQTFDENFESGVALMRNINAKLADAYKELLCLICDIVIESDGVISEVELSEAKRVKALLD